MSHKRPAFQFYPADWRKDPALSTCSIAARGLWIELMCVMHESELYGVLSINGAPMSLQQIARTVGESTATTAKLISELQSSGVFSVNESGCIYSRRMLKDERLRNVRADAGRLGGNPNLIDSKVKQIKTKDVVLLKQSSNQSTEQILTPSSSSSVNPISSSLRSEEMPPLQEKKLTFVAWMERMRILGDKPITPYKPVWEAAKALGIPDDWIEMAWIRFADSYTNSPDRAKKRYIDWRRTFLNAVTNNWLGLWYFRDGVPHLTTAGVQADILTREVA